MDTAIEKVMDFFKTKEWAFDLDEEKHWVKSGIEGENGRWQFFVRASDEEQLCFVLGLFPQNCPVDRRRACAELLTRINYGLLQGCFEMDCESGRINFKTSYPFVSGQLDAELLKGVVEFNIGMMDHFFPAIMSVIYGGTSAKRALAKIERTDTPQGPKKATRSQLPRRFLNN